MTSIRELRTLVATILLCTGLAWGATAAAQASTGAAGVTEMPIPGFPHAVLYQPDDKKPRPVVVILAGAEGGDQAGKRFGPLLARLGYAAVSLPYYSPNWGEYGPPPQYKDLPGSFIDIKVDQLAGLRKALGAMAGVDATRFGLFAGSKG